MKRIKGKITRKTGWNTKTYSFWFVAGVGLSMT